MVRWVLFLLLLVQGPSQAATDKEFENAVDAAMAHSHKGAPDIHKRALHAWKNFTQDSPQPHYSYRYWARHLVLWMKRHRKIVFDSESTVAHVFKYLYDNDKISEDAVFVLTKDVWHYLIHLEGVPDYKDKHKDNKNPRHRKPTDADSETEA